MSNAHTADVEEMSSSCAAIPQRVGGSAIDGYPDTIGQGFGGGMNKSSNQKIKSARRPWSAPLAGADRIAALDVLRGIALFGVMAINLVFDFRVSIFEQFLPGSRATTELDHALLSFLDNFISLKAFALFSLLFGVGLAIQFDRLARPKRAVLLFRRLMVLLAIGLVHLTLIWDGDILTEYAFAGLLVLPFLFGPRWLLATAGLLFLGLYLSAYLPRLVPLPSASWIADHVREATRVYATGTFSDIFSFRLRELRAFAPLHALVFPRTLALFLLGSWIWRTGLLQRASEHREALFVMALGALVATIGAGNGLATVTLAFAYAALIIGAAGTQSGSKLLGWAAPLGRMAFTNYLAQSVIFSWVFYGYGLGFFGQLGVSTALALGVLVYVAQVTFSRYWLRYYNFGPIEWLWRSLMYGYRQPMRRCKVPA
jgi:uncharacterized protein